MSIFVVPPTIPAAADRRLAAAVAGGPGNRLERLQRIGSRALVHIAAVGRVAAACRFKGRV
jgi:hypothetical protein